MNKPVIPPAVAAELAKRGTEISISPAPPSPENRPPQPPQPPARTLAERVADCAGLDHSDTDNARRLSMHFGSDLVVIAQSKAKTPYYATWTGSHWDTDNGGPRALALAQELGELIRMEVNHIQHTEAEEQAIARAEEMFPGEWQDLDPADYGKGQKAVLKAAHGALAALGKRRGRRADHAVSSKNIARLNAMLACHAPHCMRQPDEMNPGKLTFACESHTITFSTGIEAVEAPPEMDGQETIEVKRAVITALPGHRREDLITQIVPVHYDPLAKAPKWTAFIERMQPAADVRRLVQVSFGLGLVGVTVQKLFFHYGSGANGKSVAMETICRLLASASVTLPATSFTGESAAGGSSSPDLARLYGRRLLRVKEMPEGEDLKEALVKEVTGGEAVTARDLFSGYFDFEPLFTGHMSGNGYPRITGTDNGIWRRICVILWPVQLAEEERRDFEEVVQEFMAEAPGILNWLIEGVRIFLEEGLVIPDAVRAATQDYRDEMDPTSAFCDACIRAAPGARLAARDLYHAYVNWTVDQGGRPITNTRFGRIMGKKFQKETARTNVYLDIRVEGASTAEGPPDGWEDRFPPS